MISALSRVKSSRFRSRIDRLDAVAANKDVVVPQNLKPVILTLNDIDILNQEVTHGGSFYPADGADSRR